LITARLIQPPGTSGPPRFFWSARGAGHGVSCCYFRRSSLKHRSQCPGPPPPPSGGEPREQLPSTPTRQTGAQHALAPPTAPRSAGARPCWSLSRSPGVLAGLVSAAGSGGPAGEKFLHLHLALCGAPQPPSTRGDLKPSAPAEIRGPYKPNSPRPSPHAHQRLLPNPRLGQTDQALFPDPPRLRTRQTSATIFDAMHNCLGRPVRWRRADRAVTSGSIPGPRARPQPERHVCFPTFWLIKCVGDPVFFAPRTSARAAPWAAPLRSARSSASAEKQPSQGRASKKRPDTAHLQGGPRANAGAPPGCWTGL